jgi:RNA 2',3'-cyclic 3'-phosphodiesterase
MIFDVRLFTGLSLPPEMLAKMEALLEELTPVARIRWKQPSQLHITTKFIGKFPFHRTPELARFLFGLPKEPRFPVAVTGLKYHHNELDGSSLILANVEPTEALRNHASLLDHALTHYKIEREWDEYRPHITLGRIPGQNPWPLLFQKLEEYADRPFGAFEADGYHIYESTPSGYKQYVSIPFEAPSSTL